MLEDGIEDGTNPNSVVLSHNSPEPEIMVQKKHIVPVHGRTIWMGEFWPHTMLSSESIIVNIFIYLL